MKKKMFSILAMLPIAVSATVPSGHYLTWQGWNAGGNSWGGYGSEYVGAFAATNAQNIIYSSVIGFDAGRESSWLWGDVAIGAGALSYAANIYDCVALGRNVGMFANNIDTAILINNQFGVRRDKNSFYIRTDPYGENEVFYKDGHLRLNVKTIETPWADYGASVLPASAAALSAYDYYLSVYGDDNNDGLTFQTAKRTIDGCYAAALAAGKNAVVAVLPGVYAPPCNDPQDARMPHSNYILAPTNRLAFVALAGKESTSIVGKYENTSVNTNGFFHTLAFETGLQTFKGFTIKHLSNWRSSATSGGTQSKCSPMVSGCRFEDCDFLDCGLGVPGTYPWGFINTCEFQNCKFRNLVYTAPESGSGAYMIRDSTFRNCLFLDTRFVPAKSGDTYVRMFNSRVLFLYCSLHFAEIAAGTNMLNTAGPSADSSVFIVPKSPGMQEDWFPFKTSSCSNCVFYAEARGVGGGIDNDFVDDWDADRLFDENLVARSPDCRAVRDDGRLDAGWKDSGFGSVKVARRDLACLEERLARLEEAAQAEE